ncbi:MAG: HD-GYP domain-containing protein [Solirubrobacterales bacterium]
MHTTAASHGAALSAYEAPSRIVAVIDPDARQRDRLDRVLWPLYRASLFADVDSAVGRLRTAPAAILLADTLEPVKGVSPVAALRRERTFEGVPLVVLSTNGRQPDGAVDAVIRMPAPDRELIETVSRLGNRAVEAGWERLPAGPREALRRSLSAFTGLTQLIGNGTKLDFDMVSHACAPVLDVVKQATHCHLFEGLRNHNHLEFVHSVRVSTLLALFGFTIGLDDTSLMTLASAGLVHDIGKTVLPPEVVNKVGALTPTEMETARSHVHLTVQYLEKQSDAPRSVIAVAGQHHERMDGSGYPRGMPGEQINDLSRMAAIVDVFCALTERRPHRAAMGPFQALEVMQETIREKLDQRLVRVFSGMLVKAAA